MERQTGGGGDIGGAGVAGGDINIQNNALPRQREDARRRLLRPDRTPQDAVTPEQAANLRHSGPNPWELLNGRNAPTRQGAQWNFQTPQGQSAFAPGSRGPLPSSPPFPTCAAAYIRNQYQAAFIWTSEILV